MARRKNFVKGEDKYYFNVKTGQFSITIHRNKKKDAVKIFKSYKKLGKTCEWLGKWNGDKYVDTKVPK